VHTVSNKCAFVQANCPDEEAGLISYLRLYYCSLANAQPVAFIILVIWIALLFSTIGIAASDFLCINLSTIASILGMSESLAGVTFLAFGNGSPDVFSTFAAMSSHSGSLAVGELIGAASFITAVVAGSMALVRPFKVARRSFIRDVGFFVVAACFSMVFLADGRLHMWECACMVGFYVFYVMFVVTWHWWLGRRRRRRLREAAARLHHHIPRTQELDVPQLEEDDEAPATETTGLLQVISDDDFASLEGNITPTWKENDEFEDEDERQDRQLNELRSNMRVSRPGRGERRNTITPIRPSLVGALEFRSVLSSLEKRSTHATPINLRRYSDDPSAVLDQVDGQTSEPELPHNRSQSHQVKTSLGAPYNLTGRGRAVSANDAASLQVHKTKPRGGDVQGLAVSSTTALPQERRVSHSQVSAASGLSPILGSPRLFISPPASSQPSRSHSPAPPQSRSPDRLAPPETSFHRPDYHEQHHDRSPTPNVSPNMSPRSESNKHTPDVPRISIPHSPKSPPSSPFPTYTDTPSHTTPTTSRPPSIRLPPPSLSPETSRDSIFPQEFVDDDDDDDELRTFKWWPYRYLPPPQLIARTLFPTVYSWRGKSIWDKLLGVVTVPSVLLLTITLPIVETEEKDEPAEAISGLLTPRDGHRSRAGTLAQLPLDSPEVEFQSRPSDAPLHPHKQTAPQPSHPNASVSKPIDDPLALKGWNRWLVILQLFTAPLFTVLIIWANISETHSMISLARFVLSSLLFSLIALFILLATTTPENPPKYRSLLCFLGFAVAIAWISTIANEVVGVLKAFGVILGISDAILGLTIFAVGNSLGDLVADITVAKLGFPVMALSACFGGPMLNILLGIGVSGLYITIRHGAKVHHKHPDRPIKYKPYEIEVSTTLLISGITLLVTLVGLLIVVPLNGWKMDRRIGIGLCVVWGLSTVGNVIVEVLGWGGDLAVL
jgi:solute carrier family 24 (sodium/potassium/calcium exchanger), member 6